MATYRTVHLSFWTDPKVDDEFTPEDKYFYLYLLTNPHTNLCGCYEISMKQVVQETGYSVDTVERLIHRMEYVHDVIRFDPNTKEVYVLRWGKYNWADSEKTLNGVRKQADFIKSDEFRNDILARASVGYPYPIQGVSIPHIRGIRQERYPMDTSVTVHNNIYTPISSPSNTPTDTTMLSIPSKPPRQKRGTFTPPTVEEVRAYCQERQNGINPEAFIDYYQARGWELRKGQKVKDWKACVRTWERNGFNNSRPQNPNKTVLINEEDDDIAQYL